MAEVQVPVYRDGKTQMVPKYKYSDIASGEINTVVNNALTGLVTPSQGKKYLLHTHPDNTGYVQDYFSGLPNDLFKMGDASIPTLLGTDSMNNIKVFGQPVLSGYNGIYLAAPSGKLYYYNGTGNVRDKKGRDVTKGLAFPQSKVRWDYTTNTYTPGYWVLDNDKDNDQFILTP